MPEKALTRNLEDFEMNTKFLKLKRERNVIYVIISLVAEEKQHKLLETFIPILSSVSFSLFPFYDNRF